MEEKMTRRLSLNEIISITKMRGIIFPGSEIYEGLANSFDYGPVGTLILNNVKNAWFKKFIQESPYNVALDSAILVNPKVWEASGHLSTFADPLIDCRECKSRYRADKLIEDYTKGEITGDGMSNEELINYINEHNIVCPKCGKLNYTDIR